METLEAPIDAVPSTFRTKVESQGPEQDALASRVDALESQMRMVRTEQRRSSGIRPSVRLSPSKELLEVESDTQFRNWVRRWHHKVPRVMLERMAREASNIPPTEAARIQDIIEQLEPDTE